MRNCGFTWIFFEVMETLFTFQYSFAQIECHIIPARRSTMWINFWNLFENALSLIIPLPQIKYPGADMDITLSAPSFCRQISPEEFEYQRAYGSQEPLAALLEEVITDAKLSSKEKKKKLKQVKRIFFTSHFFSLPFLCCFFFLFILYFNRFHTNLIFWDRAVLKVNYLFHILIYTIMVSFLDLYSPM